MIKIGLGTVQFGLPYGNRANSSLIALDEVFAILDAAYQSGIQFIDTAASYGESETRLGQYLTDHPDRFHVSTKLPKVSRDVWQSEQSFWPFIEASLKKSAELLRVKGFDLIQFHQCEEEFLTAPSVISCFKRMLEFGLCHRLGISVYEPEQAKVAIETGFVQCLQIPVNLVDHRFLDNALLRLYGSKRISLIARSIFLQGVLFEYADIPPVLCSEKLRVMRMMLSELCLKHQISMSQAAASFVFSNLGEIVDIGLVAVNFKEELDQNLKIIENARKLDQSFLNELAKIAIFAKEQAIYSPVLWNN